MKESCHRALTTSSVLALAFLLPAGALAAGEDRKPDIPSKPNILLIVADDLGWADVGYHGSRIRTPVIDGLVKGGVELDQHYVQPLCTPTRTALLAGRYPGRFGPHALKPSNLRVLPPGTVTLASALKTLGYSTFLSGKWHLGSRKEWCPNHYGFDHSYGSLAGAVDPWTHKYRKGTYAETWHRDGELVEEEGNATELVARQAVEWVRRGSEPWLIYVPFQAVHIPIDTPAEYKQIYAGEKFFDDPVKDDSYRRFAAFVTQLDTKIGQLIQALDETGQRARTLVVFFSDNGGLPGGKNPYIGKVPDSPVLSSNLPLRGHKGQLYEGGIRVVAFASWPGRLAPRKVTSPLHAVDWLPTLAGLAGYAPATDLKWDGRDMWPVISGAVETAQPRTMYTPFSPGKAIRHGDWKLIVTGGTRNDKAGKKELYHLGRDPYEKENLASSEPERAKELERLLEEMGKDDVLSLPEDLRAFREDPALGPPPPSQAPPARP